MASTWVYILILTSTLLIYCALSLFKIIRLLWNVIKIQQVANQFTVVKPHWLKGHNDLILKKNEGAFKTYMNFASKTDKGAFTIYVGFLPFVVVCHPDTVKLVTKTTLPKGMIAATGSGYKSFVPWIGDGLLTSSGSKWSRNRRLLTPGFHFEVLKPYVKIYNECSSKIISNINDNFPKGKSIEIVELIRCFTFNVMMKCIFSSNEDFQIHGEKADYFLQMSEMSNIMEQRIFNPINYFDLFYKQTAKGKKFFNLCTLSHDIADDIIQVRRNDLENPDRSSVRKNKRQYVDFLDILLLAKDADGNGLTNIEIRDEVETFMFAGHDSTACAISWVLHNLAGHKAIQKKAQDEVDGILNKKPCPNVEWNDLNQIPYITRCIKESLRLHPPVPSFFREVSSPLELSPGYILPKGTVIEINSYAVHHNPKVWGDDHMNYNPDRFLSENISKMDSHAFIPFSAGPRNCMGQAFAMNGIKSIVMRILHEFHLYRDSRHTVEMKPDLVLRARYGIKLYFKKRKHLSTN